MDGTMNTINNFNNSNDQQFDRGHITINDGKEFID